VIPESCNSEDDDDAWMFLAIQKSTVMSPEAINVPQKTVCEVSEHCHSHQINTKLNAVKPTQSQISYTLFQVNNGSMPTLITASCKFLHFYVILEAI